jgi:hypothetical protein
MLSLPQSTATELGPRAVLVDDGQHCHDAMTQKPLGVATKTWGVVDPPDPELPKWLAGASHGQPMRIGAYRRARSFTAQCLALDGACQYLSLLDNIRNILLSCSTTLAAYSSDTIPKTKHEPRSIQEKEFVEYFDVV